MKKRLLIIACAALSQFANAQQDPQFTFWMYDKLSFNPAASGLDGMLCATAFHRDQWDGFDRDPKTYMLNLDAPIALGQGKIKGGLGLTAYTEVLGQEQNNIVRVSPTYHHDLNGMTLSVGVSLGMVAKKIGANWIYIDPDDGSIPDQQQSQAGFDLSFGAMLAKRNEWYIGISSTHLTATTLANLNVQLARHYYIMGGYNYDLNSDITLRSNVLYKSDFSSKAAFDINVNALWNNTFWGGLTFRPGDAISPMVGFQKMYAPVTSGRTTIEKAFMIGYAYDVTTTEIKDYSAGSHEIFVKFCINWATAPLRAKYSNPRFL